MTELTIRPAGENDAAAVASIYAPIVRETAISFEAEPPSTETMTARIESTLPAYPWLVATSGHQVLGYVYAGEPARGRPIAGRSTSRPMSRRRRGDKASGAGSTKF
jgi:L-amino acid N-acyltransferase YncA